MNASPISEMIYTIVDAVLNLAGLAFVLALFTFGTNSNVIVNEEIAARNTINETYLEEAYNGVSENNEIKYDGEISGLQLINDCVNSTENIPIVIVPLGRNEINLGEQVEGEKPLLEYAKEIDKNALRKYINTENTYVRHYEMKKDGSIQRILYEEQEQ